MHTIGNQIGYKVRNIATYGQPAIEINLDGGHGAHGKYVTSYATMDTIEGTVSITAPHDTRFENIEISFTGTSQVFVDRMTTTPSMTGRMEASHRFLTLKQPLDDADLPCPRKLLAGKTYTFPFLFTIPTQLLPRACTHPVTNDHIRQAHLMLPPSMGDPELAGFGGTLLDDLAPEMSKVTYGIKVRISQLRESEGTVSLLAEKMRKVRVKPVFEEQPPLNVQPSDPDYRIRQEKSIRKGLFKGKLGTLVAQSIQPRPLVIPGARTENAGSITTSAKVILRFDPADEASQPPKLGSLASKIKVSTFFAAAPRHGIPVRSSLGYDLTQGLYAETISLSSLCVGSAQWKKHDCNANPIVDKNLTRRDSGDSAISGCSAMSSDDYFNAGFLTASKNYRGCSFYTAEIIVPITCPDNKNILPTFHSCLISRTYTLSLQLTTSGAGVTSPSIHLKVPIQVAADGSDSGNANARARSVEAITARDADAMFVPRSVAPPPELEAGSDDLPPEYAAFAPNTTLRMARTDVRVLSVS